MYKLKALRIEGFKALDPIEFGLSEDVNFLIGSNGTGKSTILQALSFLRRFGDGKSDAFFSERNWDSRDIYPKIRRLSETKYSGSNKSNRSKSRPVRISVLLHGEIGYLYWEFSWSSTMRKLNEEYIFTKSTDDPFGHILTYRAGFGSDDEGHGIALNALNVDSSLLSVLKPEALAKNSEQEEALEGLRNWILGVTSLELLSPIAMRRGARGHQKNIGQSGEFLASFLANIGSEKRSRVVERLQRFYPLEKLDTTRKRAGWVDMQLAEAYRNVGKISPTHMSDGFFRLLALCTIPEFDEPISLILLDEVEDGIEPHVLPELIRQVSEETTGQLLATSHSPHLVNMFPDECVSIVVRDSEGRTRVARPGDIGEFREGLEYLGSGEIWINSERNYFYNKIQKRTNKLLRRTASKNFSAESRFKYLIEAYG